MYTFVKRVLVGRPIPTSEQEHQRLPKTVALPVFASDALSSTAYATEEILFVTAVGASSLALGLSRLVPISVVVAALLAVVIVSYRQTIFAYPGGGGSYMVSRDNLGRYPSLVAGASLLVDYVLTVAVSISAGVAAIVSLPAFRGLVEHRVGLGLALITFITLLNLRGLKESGRLFAVPTYLYMLSVGSLVVYGLVRSYFGDIQPVPFDQEAFVGFREVGGSLGLFLLLRGFSSGAVALTGIEAIADGVPAFRKPESRNAAATIVLMGSILGTLFFGISVLAHRLHPYPSHEETVISQMGRAVFGTGAVYVVLQAATAAILVLAANTAYADFPRLSSIIARDGFLPRQFANRGDRLVFSNGVVFLGLAASALIVAFDGITNALIPLYAVGVFTSFTLSQAAMVARHRNRRPKGWRWRMLTSGVGATATFVVLLIVAITKFAVGAWLPLVVVPSIIALFAAVRRHYDRVSHALAIAPHPVSPRQPNHTVIVLVGRIHHGVLNALNYARSMRPERLIAVHVAFEEGDADEMMRQWEEFGINVPLEIVHSPYRELVEPVEEYIDDLRARWSHDIVTVVIPEFVVDKWYAQVLHNHSALFLKGRLLFREGVVVISVPYHVRTDGDRGDEVGRVQPATARDQAPTPPG